VVTVGIGGLRLLGYRPEGFALGLSLLVVVLFVDWFRNRDTMSLLVACVLGAVVSQVHGIAFLTLCLLLVAATGTVLTVERSFAFVRVAFVSAGSLLGAFGALGLAMGRFSGSGTSAGMVQATAGGDPTWAFRKLALGRDPTPPPTAERMLTHSLENLYEDHASLVLVLVVTGAAVVLARARPRACGAQPLTFFVAAVGLVFAAGLVFLLGWDTYVPRRTGTDRLFFEGTMLLPVFLAGAAGVALASVSRAAPRRALTTGLVALSLAVGLLNAFELRQEAVGWHPDRRDHAALAGLELPDDAVVLANAYTEGYLHHVTGATVLLEGRAPYTFPDQLDRAVQLLLEGKQFYAEPRSNLGFLDRYGVTHVVVSAPDSFSVTSANLFDDPLPLDDLRAMPQMREVLSSPELVVLRYERR
jgi:hypothetical protein